MSIDQILRQSQHDPGRFAVFSFEDISDLRVWCGRVDAGNLQRLAIIKTPKPVQAFNVDSVLGESFVERSAVRIFNAGKISFVPTLPDQSFAGIGVWVEFLQSHQNIIDIFDPDQISLNLVHPQFTNMHILSINPGRIVAPFTSIDLAFVYSASCAPNSSAFPIDTILSPTMTSISAVGAFGFRVSLLALRKIVTCSVL